MSSCSSLCSARLWLDTCRGAGHCLCMATRQLVHWLLQWSDCTSGHSCSLETKAAGTASTPRKQIQCVCCHSCQCSSIGRASHFLHGWSLRIQWTSSPSGGFSYQQRLHCCCWTLSSDQARHFRRCCCCIKSACVSKPTSFLKCVV